MMDIIIFLIILIIMIMDVRKDDSLDYENHNITYNETYLIRGIMSCMILAHHFDRLIGQKMFLHLEYLSVGCFMGLSGYGLMEKYKRGVIAFTK